MASANYTIKNNNEQNSKILKIMFQLYQSGQVRLQVWLNQHMQPLYTPGTYFVAMRVARDKSVIQYSIPHLEHRFEVWGLTIGVFI